MMHACRSQRRHIHTELIQLCAMWCHSWRNRRPVCMFNWMKAGWHVGCCADDADSRIITASAAQLSCMLMAMKSCLVKYTRATQVRFSWMATDATVLLRMLAYPNCGCIEDLLGCITVVTQTTEALYLGICVFIWLHICIFIYITNIWTLKPTKHERKSNTFEVIVFNSQLTCNRVANVAA